MSILTEKPINTGESSLNTAIKAHILDHFGYPILLARIPDPPSAIYYRGNFEAANPANTPNVQAPLDELVNIAVVGSRNMTAYGKQAAEKIIFGLAGTNVCIVSGLAYGVDAWAHELALKAGLKTIAVLGSGIDDDSIYPRANLKLAKKILAAGGAIISEVPPGGQGMKYNFPRRNRIISGISRATIVIEAAEKSGALITAHSALDQNRDVFAVPGSIFNKLSVGANNQIKQGAKPITSAEDLLIEYPEIKLNTANNLTNNIAGNNGIPSATNRNLYNLSEIEQKVLACIQREPINSDQIQVKTQLETKTINAALATLELREKIRRDTEKNYILA